MPSRWSKSCSTAGTSVFYSAMSKATTNGYIDNPFFRSAKKDRFEIPPARKSEGAGTQGYWRLAGRIDPTRFEDYVEPTAAMTALKRALSMTPAEGSERSHEDFRACAAAAGGGFPTGTKWSFPRGEGYARGRNPDHATPTRATRARSWTVRMMESRSAPGSSRGC